MYGEHAELEYSGNSKIGDLPGHKVTDEYMLENYFSGIEPMYWKKHGFSDKDLYYYTTPSSEHMIKVGVNVISLDTTKNGFRKKTFITRKSTVIS